MTISQQRLRAATGQVRTQVAKSADDARQRNVRTVFLCHSHHDTELVKGTVNLLREAGWNVYVDWADTSMPSQPNRETARKLKDRIRAANFFLFLATQNSITSRWCPWEIGYADGAKPIDSIIILPTTDDAGRFHGNEYLQLYRRIDLSTQNELGVWEPGQDQGGILLRNL